MEEVLKYERIIYWTFILDYTKEHWKKEWNQGKMFVWKVHANQFSCIT